MIHDRGTKVDTVTYSSAQVFFDDVTKYTVYLWTMQDKGSNRYYTVGQVYDQRDLCLDRRVFNYHVPESAEALELVRKLIREAKPHRRTHGPGYDD